MTDDHILEVVQAHKEGKKIEVNLGMGWLELSKCMQEHYPNFQTGSFRVAPEPHKPREWWIIPNPNYYVDVAARDLDDAKFHDYSNKGVMIRVREVLE